jgi:hypothetical protein
MVTILRWEKTFDAQNYIELSAGSAKIHARYRFLVGNRYEIKILNKPSQMSESECKEEIFLALTAPHQADFSAWEDYQPSESIRYPERYAGDER